MRLKELEQFSGTEHYYSGFLGVKYTDGVMHLFENKCGWMVTDACAIVKMEKKVKDQAFVVVEFNINPDNTCRAVYGDGNDNLLYEQEYEYVDPAIEPGQYKMYYIDGILLLAGEY